MSEFETFQAYFREQAADEHHPSAGAFALAYAVMRLSQSLDGLSTSFAPEGLGTFNVDYFLVRVARRLDELSKQIGSLDPPEAAELLRRRPAGKGQRK